MEASSKQHACQLCGRGPLDEFVVPGQSVLRRCTDCELYQHGKPVDDSNYAAGYHVGYDRHRPQKLRTAALRLNRIAALVDCDKPKMLDIGCSVGCTVEAAARRGWDSYGVDLSRDAVAYCRDRGLTATTCGGVTLPFARETFDVVTSWHVIEHVTDVRETLAEWRRVLKPGGILALETPDAACPKVRRLGAKYRKFWPAEHLYTFTPGNLHQFVEQAGFEVLRRPTIGPTTGLSPWMLGYGLLYQGYHGLRRLAGVNKAFQIFARRSVGRIANPAHELAATTHKTAA